MRSLLTAACLLLAACAPALAQTPSQPVASAHALDDVAFSRLTIADGDHPALEAGVWTPSGASPTPRPLIVISHGNGGDFRSHQAAAQALARAGFIVASVTHTGDNWRDQSRATDIVGRTRHVSALIDYMLDQWDGRAAIDPARIGAFGFSAGGFTVLAAAGGDPDLTRLVPHCRANPAFYDCRLVSSHAGSLTPSHTTSDQTPPRVLHDTRIKALVVAAPALGFTFTRQGLAAVTQPVQLWQAGDDRILPSPFYAEPVRDALPTPPEYHRVDGAGHFDFLPPCLPQLAANAPIICAPTPGFDRAAFHEVMNAGIVRFFRDHL